MYESAEGGPVIAGVLSSRPDDMSGVFSSGGLSARSKKDRQSSASGAAASGRDGRRSRGSSREHRTATEQRMPSSPGRSKPPKKRLVAGFTGVGSSQERRRQERERLRSGASVQEDAGETSQKYADDANEDAHPQPKPARKARASSAPEAATAHAAEQATTAQAAPPSSAPTLDSAVTQAAPQVANYADHHAATQAALRVAMQADAVLQSDYERQTEEALRETKTESAIEEVSHESADGEAVDSGDDDAAELPPSNGFAILGCRRWGRTWQFEVRWSAGMPAVWVDEAMVTVTAREQFMLGQERRGHP